MIPAGTYAAVVAPIQAPNGSVSCQFGESGTKHTPFVLVRFEILRGPHAGQQLGWYGYFPETNEEVGDRTIRALRACGFRSDTFAGMPGERVNQEVQIVVEHETDDRGRARPRIQWVNAVSQGVRIENQMDASKLRLFGARFEKKLKAIGVISGPEAKRETRPAPDQSNGGDLTVPPDEGDPGPRDDGGRDTRIDDSDIPF